MFKNHMDVRQIGCASRDEELIPVGSIYVDPRSYASPFKVHDLRIAHVTRVLNVLRFINFDTSRKISGKDLQQLVDETKHHISLQEVQGQLALVFQRENTEISRILLRCDEETDEEPDEDNHVPNMIYVNGNTTIVQIFMTQYRNVIAFTTPLTDDNIQTPKSTNVDIENPSSETIDLLATSIKLLIFSSWNQVPPRFVFAFLSILLSKFLCLPFLPTLAISRSLY